MSELLYYEIKTKKPFRRFHISYNNAETKISEFRNAIISKDVIWKKVREDNLNRLHLEWKNGSYNTEQEIAKHMIDGFEVDLRKMEKMKTYLISYDDSFYELVKNEKEELEVHEIG